MTSRRRTAARVLVAVLPALTGAMVLSAPAAAAGTYRNDDGTREAAMHVDNWDGEDYAQAMFDVPAGTRDGSTSATLWVYGMAAECDLAGAGHSLYARQSNFVTTFDPCAVFPANSYGWHSFDIPLGYLSDNLNAFVIKDADAPGREGLLAPGRTGHNAYYGIDTRRDRWSTTVQTDSTGQHDVGGELMWYFVTTGSNPSMYVPLTSMYFGLREPGSPVPVRTVTVHSDGLSDLHPAVALSGARPADFTIARDTCTGQAIPRGSSCTFDVEYTRATGGWSRADVVVSAPGATPSTVVAYGEVRAGPPVSAFTTPDGATLLPGEPVRGTVTGDARVARELVTFDPHTPYQPTVTTAVDLTCDVELTSCTWATDLLRAPGRYTVTAYGTDYQNNVEPPIAPITVTVL